MHYAKAALTALALVATCATAVARGGGSHSSHSSSHKAAPGGTHHVAGHTTKEGKYVQGHRQTNPNDSKRDNWSSKGNVNPDTGKKGTKDPN